MPVMDGNKATNLIASSVGTAYQPAHASGDVSYSQWIMAEMLQVVLADDHPKVRSLLRKILEPREFRIVGEAANGEEAVDLCRTLQPDILVLDICMPVMDGIEAAKLISTSCPKTKIVVVTALAGRNLVDRALNAGAKAYVVKDHAVRTLATAIEAVQRGEIYLCPEVQEQRESNQDCG